MWNLVEVAWRASEMGFVGVEYQGRVFCLSCTADNEKLVSLLTLGSSRCDTIDAGHAFACGLKCDVCRKSLGEERREDDGYGVS